LKRAGGGEKEDYVDNDDALVGRILNRRDVLVLLGGAGALVAVGCGDSTTSQKAASAVKDSASTSSAAAPTGTDGTVAAAASTARTPACVVSPALTEGPYFVDEKLNRSDIRPEPSTGVARDGTPLALSFLVSAVANGKCTALANATVGVWHCDALGVYSDASDPGFNTKGQKFLRGYQVTNTNGLASFTTIFPGWYQGRAVHIHFKGRLTLANGKAYEFTSQLFFDDALADTIFLGTPYSTKGKRTLLNAGDDIYPQSGGQTLLTLTKGGNGYAGTFDIGLSVA
jgi:protocatechuate 3,4-dioxygenase beta subunit